MSSSDYNEQDSYTEADALRARCALKHLQVQLLGLKKISEYTIATYIKATRKFHRGMRDIPPSIA